LLSPGHESAREREKEKDRERQREAKGETKGEKNTYRALSALGMDGGRWFGEHGIKK